MEDVLKQGGQNNAGMQNECLYDVLTEEVLMQDPADSSLKICKAEEVDTDIYTLGCRQVGPAEENSDIEQHELLRDRHSKLSLILESTESSDG